MSADVSKRRAGGPDSALSKTHKYMHTRVVRNNCCPCHVMLVREGHVMKRNGDTGGMFAWRMPGTLPLY